MSGQWQMKKCPKIQNIALKITKNDLEQNHGNSCPLSVKSSQVQ